jgi:hypothetical protein
VKGREERFKVPAVVIDAGIRLLDQHPIGRAVPDAGPARVGPADAEREVRLPRTRSPR